MSAIAQARLRTVSALAEGVVAFVRALVDSAVKARAFRKTLAQLDALTDRELLDLGLSRFELVEAARRSVYGA